MGLLVFYSIGAFLALLGVIYWLYDHSDVDITLSGLTLIAFLVLCSWASVVVYIFVVAFDNADLVIYRRKKNRNRNNEEEIK